MLTAYMVNNKNIASFTMTQAEINYSIPKANVIFVGVILFRNIISV